MALRISIGGFKQAGSRREARLRVLQDASNCRSDASKTLFKERGPIEGTTSVPPGSDTSLADRGSRREAREKVLQVHSFTKTLVLHRPLSQ